MLSNGCIFARFAPHRELLCGFLSGKDELLNWEPADLFQFYYDTNPIKGSLDALLPLLDAAAVNRAIKIGAGNVFHGCVHNMLYEKNEEILKALYKSASFIVQAIYFKQTGSYVRHLEDLLHAAAADEQRIIDTFIRLKKGSPVDFHPMSEMLFSWSKKWINETK